MNLELKPRENCRFDAVSLGEIMLRFDPGEGRVRTARSFRVSEGGGEYNVVRGLHKCFGLKTAVITAFADNEVGKLLIDFIEQGGVATDFIRMVKTDGIGRTCRNGLNFTERGFGVRGAIGCSDRANTAISQMRPEDFDFDYIFGELGVRWLHTGGIYAALSGRSGETAIAACKAAHRYGTIVSYDLNYRPSMWSAIGGKAQGTEGRPSLPSAAVHRPYGGACGAPRQPRQHGGGGVVPHGRDGQAHRGGRSQRRLPAAVRLPAESHYGQGRHARPAQGVSRREHHSD